MVKKTIPQLQEALDVGDNAYFVVDTGSTTKKIKKINLLNSFASPVKTISTDTQTLDSNDENILVQSGDAPAVINLNLASPSTVKKPVRIKNIGNGSVVIDPGGSVMIDGVAGSIILDEINKAVTLVSNGVNWFIFG